MQDRSGLASVLANGLPSCTLVPFVVNAPKASTTKEHEGTRTNRAESQQPHLATLLQLH